jgi:L-ascorbate metabolism protein UlaG (beta-lactamase superfamily)
MKKPYIIIGLLLILAIIFFATKSGDNEAVQEEAVVSAPLESPVEITPISHATALLQWDDIAIYTDPVGGAQTFEGKPAANIILVTDIHSDHLNAATLKAIAASSTIIVPQAVKDALPKEMASSSNIVVLENRANVFVQGFVITAVPMYNLPEADDSRHIKGRGNGYIIEKDGFRVYVAGDTAGTPEMLALKNISIAFIPMNLPYTMSVEEAAKAVLAFKPKRVYPYHYRGQDGLSDVNKFKQLVNAGDPAIEVMLIDWYPRE